MNGYFFRVAAKTASAEPLTNNNAPPTTRAWLGIWRMPVSVMTTPDFGST